VLGEGGGWPQEGGVISWKNRNMNNLVLILWFCIERSFIISSTHGNAEIHTELRWGNLEGSSYFEDVAVGGKMILKRNLHALNGMMHTVFT